MATATELATFQRKLGYNFHNPAMLRLALTHRSAARDHNQRLEFLGDAVLGLLVADALYSELPAASEGELSQRRAKVVNREALAAFARSLSLGDLMILGQGERKSGGRQRDSILSDTVEAVLGAVYLDGGLEACRAIVSRLLTAVAQTDAEPTKDAKTRLQEWMQSAAQPLPQYQVLDVQGEEHNQVFFVSCHVSLLQRETHGEGRSRKLAEQDAAAKALRLLESQGERAG